MLQIEVVLYAKARSVPMPPFPALSSTVRPLVLARALVYMSDAIAHLLPVGLGHHFLRNADARDIGAGWGTGRVPRAVYVTCTHTVDRVAPAHLACVEIIRVLYVRVVNILH